MGGSIAEERSHKLRLEWVEVVGLYKKGKGRLETRNMTTFSTFLDPFRFRAFK